MIMHMYYLEMVVLLLVSVYNSNLAGLPNIVFQPDYLVKYWIRVLYSIFNNSLSRSLVSSCQSYVKMGACRIKKESKKNLAFFLKKLFEAHQWVSGHTLNVMIFMLNLGPGRGINLNNSRDAVTEINLW